MIILGYTVVPTDAIYENHIKIEKGKCWCGHSAYNLIYQLIAQQSYAELLKLFHLARESKNSIFVC